MKKQPKCEHCEAGMKLLDGEHWIVKGIGKIKIVACKRAMKPRDEA